MAKGLHMTTTAAQIDKYLETEVAKREAAMIQVLDMAGEIAVKNQTLAHKYLNQTGNLSSSIGFIVLNNGKVVASGGFKQEGDGKQGQIEGQNFIKEIADQYGRGLVLIVVAGRDYAVHVENMGLDVLTTAELVAENMVKKLLKEIE